MLSKRTKDLDRIQLTGRTSNVKGSISSAQYERTPKGRILIKTLDIVTQSQYTNKLSIVVSKLVQLSNCENHTIQENVGWIPGGKVTQSQCTEKLTNLYNLVIVRISVYKRL